MVRLYTVLSRSTRLPGDRKLVLDVGTIIIQFDLTTAQDNGLCIIPLTINRQSRRSCCSTANVSEQLKVLRLSCNALLVLSGTAGTRILTVVCKQVLA